MPPDGTAVPDFFRFENVFFCKSSKTLIDSAVADIEFVRDFGCRQNRITCRAKNVEDFVVSYCRLPTWTFVCHLPSERG